MSGRTCDELTKVKEQLRGYLEAYLQRQGVKIGHNKSFRCINRAHKDDHPSCGIIKACPEMFYCFSCGATGDIFTAAHYKEDKPLEGPNFVKDTVLHLAEMFGVPMPKGTFEMTEDEKLELKTYAAYRHAMQIIISGDTQPKSKLVEDKLASYKWTSDTMQRIGVGWVINFADYWKRMLALGYEADFLNQVDLDNKGIFNEHSIIFTIKDEFGNPVGFAARNLLYEEQNKRYCTSYKEIVDKEGAESPKLAGLYKPRKYINSAHTEQVDGETKAKNRIYQKGTRLFNFNLAKTYAPPLWLFEGYSDTVTAANNDMWNTTAIGSISFRREQLELILSTGQSDLIVVLDGDDAGDEGTQRLMDLLENEFGNRPGLRIRIVRIPQGEDDPDAYIRAHGARALEALEKIDAFDWKVMMDLKAGKDKHDVCNAGVGLIVNESNNILRYKKACQLAKHTGIEESAVWREVLERVDQDQAKIKAERMILVNKMSKDLAKNPAAVVTIIRDAETQLDQLEKQGRGFQRKAIESYTQHLIDGFALNTSKMELNTHWPIFDEKLAGIPCSDSVVTIPGKYNQGKTSFLANLQIRLLEYNEDIIVFAHSLDDALGWYIPRLFGSRYGFPSTWFRKYGYYGDVMGCRKLEDHTEIQTVGGMGMTFKEAWHRSGEWLQDLIASEKLIIADSSVLPGTLPAFESWVRSIRSRHPHERLVCCGDNFHIYDLPGVEDGERKIRQMSQYLKRIANDYHATVVMTMELPKESLRPGLRPTARNIKGSSGMGYDSNLNIGVYNDMKDFPHEPKLIWYDSKQPSVTMVGVEGQQTIGTTKPVIEMVFDKVKTGSSFCGSIYYKFDPDSGAMEECPILDQDTNRRLSDEPDQRSWRTQNGGAPKKYESTQ